MTAARSGGSRAGRRVLAVVITLAVLVGLAVAADFGARAVAENRIAAALESHGLGRKPSVTIEGFPFLTQLASHDIGQVQISSADVPEHSITITKLSATLNEILLGAGFRHGTVTRLNGTALISFRALANALAAKAGPLGQLIGGTGLALSAAGAHRVTASLNLVVSSGSATWRVAQPRPGLVTARLVASHNVPSTLLASIAEVRIPLPKLPLGLSITAVRVTPAGLTGKISGHDVTFGS